MPTFKTSFVTLLSILTLAFAVGCSGTTHGSGGSDSLLDACSGTFTCRADGSSSPVQSTLHVSNGSCYAGGLRLDPNHKVVDEDDGSSNATWSGNLNGFNICIDGSSACLRCINND